MKINKYCNKIDHSLLVNVLADGNQWDLILKSYMSSKKKNYTMKKYFFCNI